MLSDDNGALGIVGVRGYVTMHLVSIPAFDILMSNLTSV